MAQLKITTKTGTTYVYENHSYWDKIEKRARSKRTLIGKIDPATGEIVPTDGRGKKRSQRKNVSLEALGNMSTRFMLSTDVLDKVTEKCGLMDEINAAISKKYPLVLTLAYYAILEPDAEYYYFNRWQQLHSLPIKKNAETDDIIKIAKYAAGKYNRRSENESIHPFFEDTDQAATLQNLFNSISPEENWKALKMIIGYIKKRILGYIIDHLPEEVNWKEMLTTLDTIGFILDKHDALLVGNDADIISEYYSYLEIEPYEL